MSVDITVQNAILLSAAHTLLYVGVLYVRKASRPSLTTTKEDPSVIKARFAAVAVACVVSVIANRYLIAQAREWGLRTGIREWDDILEGWGEWKVDLRQTLHALGLTAFLFLGPLVEKIWIQQGWRYFWNEVHYSMTSLFGWKTYIIGPASEEIVFRGCIIPLFLLAKVHLLTVIFTTPLFFGLAHIHHAYEHTLHNPTARMVTIIVTFVQFTYTTLFGWYASYLFITTKTIWAPIAAHTFCNVMGLPRFMGRIPGASTFQNGMYYICLAVGTVGFARSVGSIMPSGMTLK